MRKNFLCMCVGIGVSLIGIQSNYYDKLAIFYSSHRYQELRNMILADWKEQKQSEQNAAMQFVQVKNVWKYEICVFFLSDFLHYYAALNTQ